MRLPSTELLVSITVVVDLEMATNLDTDVNCLFLSETVRSELRAGKCRSPLFHRVPSA